MIVAVLELLRNFVLPLNFFCHIMIFMGGYYVALHSRALPNWLVTCIWYIGLASLLSSITITIEWIYGPTFALAYNQIGIICETLLNITLAITVSMLFVRTILKDFQGIKRRQVELTDHKI